MHTYGILPIRPTISWRFTERGDFEPGVPVRKTGDRSDQGPKNHPINSNNFRESEYCDLNQKFENDLYFATNHFKCDS